MVRLPSRGRGPADWPDPLDQARLAQFLAAYGSGQTVDTVQVDCLPDLMIEALIAEAVLPIAAMGTFGHLRGIDFLAMILRKARWPERPTPKARGLFFFMVLRLTRPRSPCCPACR